jgi:hypothetical protein
MLILLRASASKAWVNTNGRKQKVGGLVTDEEPSMARENNVVSTIITKDEKNATTAM